MGIDSTHPEFDCYSLRWGKAEHFFQGEDSVKSQRTIYLPATTGMIADGMANPEQEGYKAYEGFLQRAFFPDNYSEAVEKAVGAMHRKPPAKIELPPQMESLIDRATPEGESLAGLLRKINTEQIKTGRIGLLGDIESVGGKAYPVVSTHDALVIRNWDTYKNQKNQTGTLFVVIDESGHKRIDDMQWTEMKGYRRLVIGREKGAAFEVDPEGGQVAHEIYEEKNLINTIVVKNGTRRLEEIPFVAVNAGNLSLTPSPLPLRSLLSLCHTIYMGEGDYRQHLHAQGQDTFCTFGAGIKDGETLRLGSGSQLDFPQGATAEFVGVDSKGLTEQREGLDSDYIRAEKKGSTLTDSSTGGRESGEALRTRLGSQTVTLPLIALTGAAGLQMVLRKLAPLFNANPEQIIIEPNLEFTEIAVDGKNISDLQTAKNSGLKISDKSLHSYAKKGGATEMEYEDELEEIRNEEPLPSNPGGAGSAGGAGLDE